MAYKPNHGRGQMIKTGRGIPLNMTTPLHSEGHGAPEGHKHESDGSDRYTYQATPNVSTKNVSRRAIRKEAKNLYQAAQAGYGGQAYSTGAQGLKVKLGGNKLVNISNNRSGVVSGYGTDTPEYNESNQSVTKRQIRNQLKSSGSVNISNGNVSSGTTLTTTRSGSVKRDTHKANLKTKKENFAAKKATEKQSLITARANKKAELETKRNEYKEKSAAKKARLLAARKAAKAKGRV